LATQVSTQYGQPAIFKIAACAVLGFASCSLRGRERRKFGQGRRAGLRSFCFAAPGPYRFLLGEPGQCVGECVVRHAPPLFLKALATSMSDMTDFSASQAAWKRLTERMGAQNWPASTLYVVATPIGNLGDLSLRACETLTRCDVIAAEDTRASRSLLDAWGIATPLMAAHRHNEASAAQTIVERLERGERVALVSDAGAPAVSDPGARIVRAVREAGYGVVAIPGASAVITALMASGVTSDENPAFVFAGFMPAKSAARQKWLRRWCALPAPVVMFESPHRLTAAIKDLVLVCGPER